MNTLYTIPLHLGQHQLYHAETPTTIQDIHLQYSEPKHDRGLLLHVF